MEIHVVATEIWIKIYCTRMNDKARTSLYKMIDKEIESHTAKD